MQANIKLKDNNSCFLKYSNDIQNKIIELGINFYESGIRTSNSWDNKEWNEKIEKLNQKNIEILREKEELVQKNERIQKEYYDEIKSSLKIKYESELNERDEKFTKLNNEYNSLYTSLNDKLSKELTELRGFYEEKIKEKDTKLEDIHSQYIQKLDNERQITSFKTQNSTIKGQEGEEHIFQQLNLLFPSAEIEDTHKIPARGDFILKEDGIVLMIENKNYSKNVQKSEIDKFYRDIDNESNNDTNCAILVSLKTGICNKKDFEFEVRNNKPILFIHKLNDNLNSLKLAVQLFKLILNQKSLNLKSNEVKCSLKNISSSIKRNHTKLKSKLDKFHKEQIELLTEQQQYVLNAFELFNC